MPPEKMLLGRAALVTGGGSGIGLATVVRFLEEGASVLVVDLNTGPAESSIELAPWRDQPDRLRFQSADVSQELDCSRYSQFALECFGKLDILVLGAGVAHAMMDWVDVPEKVYALNVRVNVRGVWLGIKHGVRAMTATPRENQGAIVLLSSMAALAGRPKLSAYSASKWSVRGLGQVAAAEFGPLRIRTNVVLPGATATPMVLSTFTDEKRREMEAAYAIGRMARPDEMSSVITFLVSSKASFINGATVAVHAGIMNIG